jgi:hypothetical protein
MRLVQAERPKRARNTLVAIFLEKMLSLLLSHIRTFAHNIRIHIHPRRTKKNELVDAGDTVKRCPLVDEETSAQLYKTILGLHQHPTP